MSDMKNHLYYGKQVSLQSILFDGMNGGPEGIHRYLEARISQAQRRVFEEEPSSIERNRLELAHLALLDALALIPLIRQPGK